MIFNTASDILDPVKLNYCPLFKNLPQIQIKIFKLIIKYYHGLCQSLWQSSTSMTSIQTQILWNQESNIKLDLCRFIKPYTNSGYGWRVNRYCSGHFWCPSGNISGSCSFSGIYKWLTRIFEIQPTQTVRRRQHHLQNYQIPKRLWKSPRRPWCCRKMGKWLADGFPPRQMLSSYNNKQETSCKT